MCKWSFFDTEACLKESLIQEGTGYRALAKEYRFTGAAFLLNPVKDNDILITAIAEIIPKLPHFYNPQRAVAVTLPSSSLNCQSFLNIRQINPNVGVFDNKNNRYFEQQVNSLRGWLNAFMKSIRPASGVINDVRPSNSGPVKRGKKNNRGGRGRGRGRGKPY